MALYTYGMAVVYVWHIHVNEETVNLLNRCKELFRGSLSWWQYRQFARRKRIHAELDDIHAAWGSL